MQIIPASTEIQSLGYASMQLGLTIQRAATIAVRLGITAVQRVDGVPFFNSADVEKIAEYLELDTKNANSN